jgi:hypothetical protein
MRMLSTLISPSMLLVVAGVIATCDTVHADEIQLNDGRVLEGEIISKAEADVVDLRTASGGISVTQHIPRHQIVSITIGTTPRQAEQAAIAKDRKALGEGGSAQEWYALVERARAVGDGVLARDLAEEVVSRDRQHAEAHKLLGHSSYRGVWMRQNESNLAQGLVIHKGRFVTWDQRDELIAKADAEREAAEARRTQREEDRRRRQIQAASVAALASTPDPYYAYPTTTAYRAVYWPAYCNQVLPRPAPVSNVSINAGGGSSGFSWNFSWNSGGW